MGRKSACCRRRLAKSGDAAKWVLAGRSGAARGGLSEPLAGLALGEDPSGATRLFALGASRLSWVVPLDDSEGWHSRLPHCQHLASCMERHACHAMLVCVGLVAGAAGLLTEFLLGDASAAAAEPTLQALWSTNIYAAGAAASPTGGQYGGSSGSQPPRPTALCFAPPMPYFQRGCDATLLLVASSDCSLLVWDVDAQRAVARWDHGSTVPQPLVALLTFRAAACAAAEADGLTQLELASGDEGAEESGVPAGQRQQQQQQREEEPAQAWVAFAACGSQGSDRSSSTGGPAGVFAWPLQPGEARCPLLAPAGLVGGVAPQGAAVTGATIAADASWLAICNHSSGGGGGALVSILNLKRVCSP